MIDFSMSKHLATIIFTVKLLGFVGGGGVIFLLVVWLFFLLFGLVLVGFFSPRNCFNISSKHTRNNLKLWGVHLNSELNASLFFLAN